jgi:hypothetical protein
MVNTSRCCRLTHPRASHVLNLGGSHSGYQHRGSREPQVVMAAKQQRPRLPVRTLLPLIPRIRRPQRFAFVTNPADLDPHEVHATVEHTLASLSRLGVALRDISSNPPPKVRADSAVIEQVDALWRLAFGTQPQEPRRWRTLERWETVLRHSYAVSGFTANHSFALFGDVSCRRFADCTSCMAVSPCHVTLQVQAVFEVIPAPRAGSEAQQSRRRLVGFARCDHPGALPSVDCATERAGRPLTAVASSCLLMSARGVLLQGHLRRHLCGIGV